MKKILLVLVSIILFTAKNWGQDTLVLNDGNEMHVKVVEIDKSLLRYKKKENPAGPLYSIDIATIFMIFYANGSREIVKGTGKSPGSKETDPQTDGNNPAPDDDNMISENQYGWKLKLESIAEDPLLLKKHEKMLGLAFNTKFIRYKTGKISIQVNDNYFTDAEFGVINTKKVSKGKNAVRDNLIYFFIPMGKPFSSLLFGKYESILGKGGLYVPPGFLENGTGCQVLLLFEYSENSNNKISLKSNKNGGLYYLQDCESINKKVLSAALTWLKINFNNAAPDSPEALSF